VIALEFRPDQPWVLLVSELALFGLWWLWGHRRTAGKVRTCERCLNRPAEVHLTTIKDNETTIRWLCMACSHAEREFQKGPPRDQR
jgi:hypothetical protein